jgi:hypothetical protein
MSDNKRFKIKGKCKRGAFKRPESFLGFGFEKVLYKEKLTALK